MIYRLSAYLWTTWSACLVVLGFIAQEDWCFVAAALCGYMVKVALDLRKWENDGDRNV